MLTIIDVPKEVLALHQESKETARQIVEAVAAGSAPVQQKHGADIVAAFPASVIYVTRGILKAFYNDKFVRFYAMGDIAVNLQPSCRPYRIVGEMATEVIVVPGATLTARLAADSALLGKWNSYCEVQKEILQALCASYAGEEFQPNIDLRQFNKDDVIIQEGTNPDCLFEMIEGSASVRVGDTEVGTVSRGEVFGEISFLTASPRSATVVATSSCLVQAINGNDFEKIVKYRPTLVHSMARTIAKRLTEVNARLVRIATLT